MSDQLRMSWVTLDRFPQEGAAKDEPLRRKLEADNKPLRSSAAKLTDGELLDKLRGMGRTARSTLGAPNGGYRVPSREQPQLQSVA